MVVMQTKQQKITKLWRKQDAQIPEDCEDLEDEIKELEKKLEGKQIELFQVQRSSCKRKVALNKSHTNEFSRPKHIIETRNKVRLEKNLEWLTMMTGMEVKSYAQDHCVIIYHMQHTSAPHNTLHGLRINTEQGVNTVSNYSMPLGFNFEAVLEKYESIMTPDCLVAIRNALVAYYDRLQQFEELKSLLSIDGQLFKVMDTSHVEVTFKVQMVDEEAYNVVLTLHYRVYDFRPKLFYIKGADLDRPALDVLTEQCALFKKKPLQQAFAECFLENEGPYNIVRLSTPLEVMSRRRRRKQKRRPQHPYTCNNDDTFRPEDCSDDSEEDDDERGLRKAYGRP